MIATITIGKEGHHCVQGQTFTGKEIERTKA